MLSCVLSLGLSAQDTYTWAHLNDYEYVMYKHGFFNDNIQKLFSIPDSLFTHNNMTGYTNFVNAFEFTKDRSQVYFLEEEGDLYLYTIDIDKLEYLGDITPETSPPIIYLYTSTLGLFFINDSTLYIHGGAFREYNINARAFKKIRQPTDFITSVTPEEKEILSRCATKYKDRYMYISAYPHLNELFLDNPDTNKNIFMYDSIWIIGWDITTYQHDCDSISLYVLGDSRNRPIQGVHNYWYKIDMNTGRAIYSHPSLKSKFLDTTFVQYQTRHYNSKDWQDCQRIVDLDEDDSTVSDIDFKLSGLCYHSGIPISDNDVKISNEFPLDSIEIMIENARFGQEISIQSGNYIVRDINSSHKIIINNGNTTNKDFAEAIKAALYIDTGQKQGGNIIIDISAWYDGEQGRVAKARIDIVNPLPNAGADIDEEYCQTAGKVTLIDLLADTISTTGKFYLGNNYIDNVNLDNTGEDTIYYIIENQGCYDTAKINIVVHPIPDLKGLEDQYLCYGQSAQIDLSQTDGDIQWDNGSSDKIRTLSIAGRYHYTVTNEFDCSSSDTFEIKISEAPSINPVEAKICTGEIFKFLDKEYLTSGNYTDTLYSQDGCDSAIYNIHLSYFDKIPIEYTGKLGFCEGENTKITIISNHEKISVNGSDSAKEFELSNEGTYHISAYDANGCLDTANISIVQYPAPEVMTEDLLDITFQSGIKLPVQYFGDITEYIWTPIYGLDCTDCPYPELTEKIDNVYTIKVINSYGCMDEADLIVRFKKVIYEIPNVILNNPSNPINGMFYVKSNTEFNYDLKIYNRWGNLVFEKDNIPSNDPNAGWQPSGKVNPGVFVYLITFEENDKEKVISGDITVL